MLSLRFLGLALIATPAALASDVTIAVTSAGSGSLVVAPGAQVPYTVTLELGDASTDGLAGFAFDLVFDGGDLSAATAPASGPTLAFRSPTGFSNPAGFGGTLIDGDLVQVGGAQNTIQNFFAPKPSGAVTTGVGQPGSSVLVLSGTLQVPTEGGTFTLSAANAIANAIVAGQSGFPFYAVEALNVLSDDLVVTVPTTLTRDIAQVSLVSGGQQNLSLNAGAANAGRVYLMLGSLSGTLPGVNFGGVNIPLNVDPYFQYTLSYPNAGLLSPSLGVLNGLGQASATLSLPAGTPSGLAGTTVSHAFLLLTPGLDFTSNSVSLTLIP